MIGEALAAAWAVAWLVVGIVEEIRKGDWMPSFKADSAVEALDYDFMPYANSRGVIKEPSDRQIAQFLDDCKRISKEAQDSVPADADTSTPAGMLAALDMLNPEQVVAVLAKMADAYESLCSGTPTAADMLSLPMRVRQLFFVWLQQEVMSPEAGPGAGIAAANNRKRAAAG